MISYDDVGPFLMLSPVEAADVVARLSVAGISFRDDEGGSAGCAGPEVVILRLEAREGLELRVQEALREGPTQA